MSGRILTLNAGSSSIKFALYAAVPDPSRVLHGVIAGLATAPAFSARAASGEPLSAEGFETRGARTLTHQDALQQLFDWLARHSDGGQIVAVGHRVVHGGMHFAEPVRIDAAVHDELEKLIPMAPLHQPHNLAAMRALLAAQPALLQVACFDTAFHRSQPAMARNFALPRELTQAGVRRYGFHGLSYEYIAGVLPRYLDTRAEGRVIVAHLGNGASLCAMSGRHSVATTMGFTALDGLMMGTRSGAVDPGVVFYLMREKSMTAAEVEHLLYHRSGLLGVSAASSDMRELLESRDPRAREAVELFAYRAARELGSLTAALEGLDALVFTAGIGEQAAPVRSLICQRARWLGIELDEKANRVHAPTISTPASRVAVCVIPTDEESVIARHTYALLQHSA